MTCYCLETYCPWIITFLTQQLLLFLWLLAVCKSVFTPIFVPLLGFHSGLSGGRPQQRSSQTTHSAAIKTDQVEQELAPMWVGYFQPSIASKLLSEMDCN